MCMVIQYGPSRDFTSFARMYLLVMYSVCAETDLREEGCLLILGFLTVALLCTLLYMNGKAGTE